MNTEFSAIVQSPSNEQLDVDDEGLQSLALKVKSSTGDIFTTTALVDNSQSHRTQPVKAWRGSRNELAGNSMEPSKKCDPSTTTGNEKSIAAEELSENEFSDIRES